MKGPVVLYQGIDSAETKQNSRNRERIHVLAISGISDERSMRESAGKLDKFHSADQRQQT